MHGWWTWMSTSARVRFCILFWNNMLSSFSYHSSPCACCARQLTDLRSFVAKPSCRPTGPWARAAQRPRSNFYAVKACARLWRPCYYSNKCFLGAGHGAAGGVLYDQSLWLALWWIHQCRCEAVAVSESYSVAALHSASPVTGDPCIQLPVWRRTVCIVCERPATVPSYAQQRSCGH